MQYPKYEHTSMKAKDFLKLLVVLILANLLLGVSLAMLLR